MKISVQVAIQADDDTPTVVHEVFALDRGTLAPGTLGLRLDEAKDILAAVQEKMVSEQVQVALARRLPARPARRPTGIRTPARSWCGPCSACYA